jgi:hypothetical protein
MRRSTVFAALLVLALPIAARAQSSSSAAPPSFTAMSKETRTAKIIHIDKASRVVTMVGSAHGDTLDVLCGEEVKNFAQLKVGDEVKSVYTESFTIHVEGSGEVETTTETMTSRAKPGEMPAASVTERTTAKATIKAIDKAKGTATLQPLNGEPFTVTAEDKANLDKVQVGNVVVVTYTVGHAVSVSKAKPAKASNKAKG